MQPEKAPWCHQVVDFALSTSHGCDAVQDNPFPSFKKMTFACSNTHP